MYIANYDILGKQTKLYKGIASLFSSCVILSGNVRTLHS